MTTKAPVFFISHGAPSWALETGEAGRLLQQYSSTLENVEAIVILSPHWMRNDSCVMATPAPQTLYDFAGFPNELYALKYPALGDTKLAIEIYQQLHKAGISTCLDYQRGFDHGVWVPLRYLLPEAKHPVIQISLNAHFSFAEMYALGQQLAILRQQGIAIIGSGGITHNLHDMRFHTTNIAAYAQRFQTWVTEQLSQRHITQLINASTLQADFKRAHPTAEHYLPLLFALGATSEADQFTLLESSINYHALSMNSYLWQ